MRFVVYLALLGTLIFFGIALFQVILKRVTDRDRVRKVNVEQAKANLNHVYNSLKDIETYCDNAVIVNPGDLTALYVLNVLRKTPMKENT